MQKREAPWPNSETETFSVVVPDGYTITDVGLSEGRIHFRAAGPGIVYVVDAIVVAVEEP